MVFKMLYTLFIQLYIRESKDKSVLIIKHAFIIDGDKLKNK